MHRYISGRQFPFLSLYCTVPRIAYPIAAEPIYCSYTNRICQGEEHQQPSGTQHFTKMNVEKKKVALEMMQRSNTSTNDSSLSSRNPTTTSLQNVDGRNTAMQGDGATLSIHSENDKGDEVEDVTRLLLPPSLPSVTSGSSGSSGVSGGRAAGVPMKHKYSDGEEVLRVVRGGRDTPTHTNDITATSGVSTSPPHYSSRCCQQQLRLPCDYCYCCCCHPSSYYKIGNTIVICPKLYNSTRIKFGIVGPHWYGLLCTVSILIGATTVLIYRATTGIATNITTNTDSGHANKDPFWLVCTSCIIFCSICMIHLMLTCCIDPGIVTATSSGSSNEAADGMEEGVVVFDSKSDGGGDCDCGNYNTVNGRYNSVPSLPPSASSERGRVRQTGGRGPRSVDRSGNQDWRWCDFCG